MAGETYTKRYAGGFADGSGGGTPVDSQFLNTVETALLRLLGEDPVASEVPVWSAASARFVFQKITNDSVSASAAIDKTKLASLAIVDADVSGAAAIAQSKLALDIVNANVSASAAIAISKLADPTTGKVIGSSGSAAAAVYPPGYTLDYAEYTLGAVVVSSTNEASPNDVVVGNSVSFDGTAVWLEFYCPYAQPGGTLSDQIIFMFYDGTTSLGRAFYLLSSSTTAAQSGVFFRRRYTPSAGSHTFKVGAIRAGTSNGTAGSGVGGSGNPSPAYIRVTKA